MYIFLLKVLRKLYMKLFGSSAMLNLEQEMNADKTSEMIYNLLASDEPCMIARYGSTELSAVVNYLGVKSSKHSIIGFITNKQLGWWWNKNIMNQMTRWSGFFPSNPETITRFSEMMLEDTKQLDLLGSWVSNERYLANDLSDVSKVSLVLLEPYHSSNPWSRILEKKKVLVVHPFAELIESQYKNRDKLFADKSVLPEFESLQTIQAVQSLGGENNGFKDWFEALQWMKNEIDKCDYDICLIGCGAYGFPLAAHVKRQGKKAVHLGGALQLLFGIIGKRWEVPDYASNWGLPVDAYSSLVNEYWVRPTGNLKPSNSSSVEGGCYR